MRARGIVALQAGAGLDAPRDARQPLPADEQFHHAVVDPPAASLRRAGQADDQCRSARKGDRDAGSDGLVKHAQP